jgi:hypothetical protein
VLKISKSRRQGIERKIGIRNRLLLFSKPNYFPLYKILQYFSGAQVLIIMVTNEKQAESALFGDGGAVAGMQMDFL